jgi:hypothetical protein
MSLARRLSEHFVMPAGEPVAAPYEAPADRDEAPARASAQPPPFARVGVAVLTAAPDAPALGAALGLALARLHRVPVVVVCMWTGGQAPARAWRGPAWPAARRLAGGLAARGHDARPAGRLVVVWLAGADDAAAPEARRVLAAAGAAPAVLALGGPRPAAFDVLLADQDLVVVGTRSGADPTLGRLALAGLAGRVRACGCEVPGAHSARSLAVAGVALLPSARRALAGPVAELS